MNTLATRLLLLSHSTGRTLRALALFMVFFGLITPVALVLKMAGTDSLRRKRTKATSYWLERKQASPTPESFTKQF